MNGQGSYAPPVTITHCHRIPRSRKETNNHIETTDIFIECMILSSLQNDENEESENLSIFYCYSWRIIAALKLKHTFLKIYVEHE